MERLIEVGRVKPVAADAKKCNRFGIGLEKLDRDVFDPEKTYDKLADLGTYYVRLQSGWARTEREEGYYDFEWLDKIVDNLMSRGMKPWFCLCYGNPVYTESAKEYFGAVGCPPIHTEHEREGWANYCRAIALHFRGRVSDFEVWNEPDGIYCWKHGVSGVEYGEFCKATGKAIKEVCPESKIYGCAYWAWHKGFKWIEEALQTGMYEYIDAITYHEYTISEEHIFERVSSLRALLKKYGDIKVIQGEAGCPSSSKGYGALRKCALTEKKQAKLLLRRQFVDYMTGVEFSSVFSTVDMIEALQGETDKPSTYLDYGYFGLLGAVFDENGRSVGEYKPKISYYAYQNFLGIMGNDVPAACDLPLFHLPEYTDRYLQADVRRSELIATGLEKENGSFAYVYWKPAHLLSTDFNGTVSFQTSGLPDDVKLVDPMTGKVYEFPPELMEDIGCGIKWFHHIPVTDYPLLITFGDFLEVRK